MRFEKQVYKEERLRGLVLLSSACPDCWILRDMKRFSFEHKKIDLE